MSSPMYNEVQKTILPPGGVVGQSINVVSLGSTSDALTAHAGGGQASALLLTSSINRVTVVATAGDSVRLPAAQPGMKIYIINSDSSDSMDVFPATGETINAVAANGAFAMAAGARNQFVCPVAGKWFTFPLANS